LRPSAAALAAVRGCLHPQSAPEPDAGPLRAALARRYGIAQSEAKDAVRVGAGSAALLHAVIAAHAAAGRVLVVSQSSWPPYTQIAAAYGQQPRVVPLRDYRHDLPAITDAAGTRPSLVVLDSPHWATGTTIALPEVRAAAQTLPAGSIIVVDNAYGEYQDDDLDDLDIDLRDTVAAPDCRVLISRTFSKAHQLFGLRVGYMMAAPPIMGAHGPLVGRYDVSRVGHDAALASLTDPGQLAANRQVVRDRRAAVTALLDAAGIPHAAGQGHAVLFTPPRPAEIASTLRAAGATVLDALQHGLPGHLALRLDDPAGDVHAALSTALEA
jgi:histidinol-phosphate aminotransferase